MSAPGALDPQSQAVVDALNASGVLPFSRFEPADVRAKILSLRVQRPPNPTLEMTSSDETIDTADGAFRVRVLRPRVSGAMPAVIYFHGGGFFAGGIDETDELARRIAKQTNAVVFNVDYPLAPETKFPVAVNAAYAT